jgi:hypothetical protein
MKSSMVVRSARIASLGRRMEVSSRYQSGKVFGEMVSFVVNLAGCSKVILACSWI